MRLGIARSGDELDGRVAAVPDTVTRYGRIGVTVLVETGAGLRAGYGDEDYLAAGAEIVQPDGLGDVDVLACVTAPPVGQLEGLSPDTVLVGLLRPVHDVTTAQVLATRGVTAFAMELIPRISRAQSMDALSSQAGVAGYKAVLLAANAVDKLFPLSMTAAGTIRPASVIVLGTGVAGLQAVATAKRLGATVKANDVRAAAADEVASLGADFIHIPGVTDQQGGYATDLGKDLASAQHEALRAHIKAADAVICTAAIPGRRAPTLLTADMVAEMRPGSVIIDLPADDGGNCELTDPQREVVHAGVRIIPGPQLARSLPREASGLYARNVAQFVALLVSEDGSLVIDAEDEIVASTLLTRSGEILHEPTAEAVARGSQARASEDHPSEDQPSEEGSL